MIFCALPVGVVMFSQSVQCNYPHNPQNDNWYTTPFFFESRLVQLLTKYDKYSTYSHTGLYRNVIGYSYNMDQGYYDLNSSNMRAQLVDFLP